MYRLEYKNDYGSFVMAYSDWRIIEIDGLGLPSKTYNTVSYAGTDGYEINDEATNARTITVKGDIESTHIKNRIEDAVKVLNHPGKLYIQSNQKKRSIPCVCTSFEPVKVNSQIYKFTLQFTAPQPFFEDFKNKTVYIFKRDDLINLNNGLTLPQIFTRRTNIALIQNKGDKKTEPIIYLHNNGISGENENDKCGYEITNTLPDGTVQSLYLENIAMSEGEVITIDIPSRRITSNISGNLIKYLSADSFMSKFMLEVGSNNIEIINHNLNESISACVEYTNKYTEAVI